MKFEKRLIQRPSIVTSNFVVAKKFLSLYPFSGKVIAKLGDKLKGFETTTGSVHFSVEHPLSEALLKEIIALRLKEIEG